MHEWPTTAAHKSQRGHSQARQVLRSCHRCTTRAGCSARKQTGSSSRLLSCTVAVATGRESGKKKTHTRGRESRGTMFIRDIHTHAPRTAMALTPEPKRARLMNLSATGSFHVLPMRIFNVNGHPSTLLASRMMPCPVRQHTVSTTPGDADTTLQGSDVP